MSGDQEDHDQYAHDTDADTTRTLAEAMGWTDLTQRQVTWRASESLQGHRPGSRHHWYGTPDYLHDANAALEAAREIVCAVEDDQDAGPWLWYDRHHKQWRCDDNTATGGKHTADTPAAALCAMILAVLAERKDAT